MTGAKMSAVIASRQGAVVRLYRCMQTVTNQLRQLSSTGSARPSKDISVYYEKGDTVRDSNSSRTWPDVELTSLHPYDGPRFPVPGNSSLAPELLTQQTKTALSKPGPAKSDILTTPTNHERQCDVLDQVSMFLEDCEKVSRSEDVNHVEIRVQDCPYLMRKDFQELFPGSAIMTGDFTVISICQKANHDMTSWSADVGTEREELIKLYVDTAQEICSQLKNAGYWADFIDPCSGKPHIGAYTTATMFETDERYRYFGFEIEDLGCCKVIKHHLWGTQSYVGCIFTNTPSTHHLLVELEAAALE